MHSESLVRKIQTGSEKSPWMGFRKGGLVSEDHGDAKTMGPKKSARLISSVRDVKNYRIRVRSL